MSIDTRSAADTIRSAARYLTSLSPAFGERYQAAAALLARGYTRDGERVIYRDGVAATAQSCTCQEGPAIECLHKIGARILGIVDRWGAVTTPGGPS